MGFIIALANQKGGVGKTTLTVHIAAMFAKQGRRVSIIDADPQANATSWLLDGMLPKSGLLRLLVAEEPMKDVVMDVASWGVRLVPGDNRTGKAMASIARDPVDTIYRAIAPLADTSDYVFLDMPPSKSVGFVEMLYASDWVLIPTTLERPGIEGVHFMVQTIKEIYTQYESHLARERRKGPRLLGIVPNMMRRTVEHAEQLKILAEKYGPLVWPPIPQSVRVSEAWSYGETVFDYAPKASVTEAIGKIVKRVEMNA